jgi:hypothetical protein
MSSCDFIHVAGVNVVVTGDPDQKHRDRPLLSCVAAARPHPIPPGLEDATTAEFLERRFGEHR